MSDKLENMMMQYLPSDKVIKISGEVKAEVVDEQPEAEELPEWLLSQDLLDSRAGLKNCGSAEVYLNAIETFADSSEENYELISRYFAEKQTEDYTIKVHALKSSARIIGAAELSTLAARLEKAGDERDIETIEAETPKLLKDYKQLSDMLRKGRAEAAGDKSDLPLIDNDYLSEALSSIKELAASFDYDSVNYIMDTLGGYSFPEEKSGMMEKLKTAVMHADWDAINAALEN